MEPREIKGLEIAAKLKRAEAAESQLRELREKDRRDEADAARWRKYHDASHTLPDGLRIAVHLNVAVNVWRGEEWLEYHECSPDEFDAALAEARKGEK